MKVIIAAVGVTLMAGQAIAGPPEYRTVDWYVAHRAERQIALEWCRNNTGLAARVPSCHNAASASIQAPLNMSFGADDTPRWRGLPVLRVIQLDKCRRYEGARLPMSPDMAMACRNARAG